MKIDFGKFRGRELEDVPTDYLLWLFRKTKQTRKNIQRELIDRDLLDEEDEEENGQQRRRRTNDNAHIPTDPSPLFDRLIDEGFKSLAQKLHPDRGGSTAQMQELNNLRDRLRQARKKGT